MESLQGFLLVAAPALVDPNFRQTVILIVQHSDDEGALGLVLNRQTSTTVAELWERLGQEGKVNDGPVSLGGPCEGPLMALHTEKSAAEIEVLPGLYFSAAGEQLRSLAVNSQVDVRFFFGYAGWGAGQLENELSSGAWRTEPASLKHIFVVNQQLWERSMSEAAGWEVLAALRIKDIPVDPSRN
ncbi:MAG TPA: YqgE/AlgH family protein [Pirellulales bacterium]|jgi:putative transcriptional regulator